MAKLTTQQKRFIVEHLALFSSPTEVAGAVFEHFGIDVPRQQVNNYDASKPYARKGMAAHLVELFDRLRKQFMDETAEIAISHKTYRLRTLDRNERQAWSTGNIPLSNACLEQAAKEMGRYYTNARTVDLSVSDRRARDARRMAKELQHLTLEELEALGQEELMEHFIKPGQS